MSTKKRTSRVILIASAGGAVAIIGLFVALAYQHAIVVPLLSPTIITVEGLRSEYEKGGMINYDIEVNGYGSNCHSLEVRTFLVSNTDQKDPEVYFYKKADDCKHMDISFSPYNYTRAFTYGGPPIIGTPGSYKVTIDFVDLVNSQKASTNRFFTVVG
jgi:hypothetical protein